MSFQVRRFPAFWLLQVRGFGLTFHQTLSIPFFFFNWFFNWWIQHDEQGFDLNQWSHHEPEIVFVLLAIRIHDQLVRWIGLNPSQVFILVGICIFDLSFCVILLDEKLWLNLWCWPKVALVIELISFFGWFLICYFVRTEPSINLQASILSNRSSY